MRNLMPILLLAATAVSVPAVAQSPGAYTSAQAERGLADYRGACGSCHGSNMQGAPGAPALSGPEFSFRWDHKSLGDLYGYVRTKMPPGAAGSLPDRQYADIVAAILRANDEPSGPAELQPSDSNGAPVHAAQKDPP